MSSKNRLVYYDNPSLQQVAILEPHSAISSASFTNGSTIEFRIPNEQYEKINGLTLKWTIAESGASNSVTVIPATLFHDEIEYKENNGTRHLLTTHGDVSHWYACALPDQQEQNDGYRKALGYSSNWYAGSNLTIAASGSQVFYVKLNELPHENHAIYVGAHDGYTQILVKCRTVIKASGSGTVSLSNCQLILDHEAMSKADMQNEMKLVNTVKEINYLDWEHLQFTSKTLTASTEALFDLSPIQGDVPFLVMAIRADSYSASSQGLLGFKSLGDGAKLDLQTSSGKSLLGKGTAVDLDFMNQFIYSKHFDNNFNNRNLYIIPFCRSVKASIAGVKNGYYRFTGAKDQLMVQPSAAGTACVQTLNCNNPANDGGYYKLAFKGHVTDALAYNANAAAIKTALEALPSFRDWNGGQLTVTASGALTTDATLTFPSVDVEPPNDDLVQVISESLNDGTVAEFVSTSVTTRGKRGFTSASTYTVDLYVPIFNRYKLKGGRHAKPVRA